MVNGHQGTVEQDEGPNRQQFGWVEHPWGPHSLPSVWSWQQPYRQI